MSEETVWQAARNWAGVVLPVGLGAIAIWQDRIQNWRRRPKLKLLVKTAAPDCDLTHLKVFSSSVDATGNHLVESGEAECYFFRLRIRNDGQRLVEKVEVYVEEVHKRQVDHTFVIVQKFPPMNLVWSHIGTTELSIPPGMEKFCDFGMLIQPEALSKFPIGFAPEIKARTEGGDSKKTVFTFTVQVKPNHGGHVVPFGPYRVKLAIGAANLPVQKEVVEMSFSGDWHISPEKMYVDGFRFAKKEPGDS